MNELVPIKRPASPAPAEDFQILGPADDFSGQSSPLRIKRFLTFLAQLWWVPLLTLLLGVAAAGAYIYFAPPTYVSKASLWSGLKLRLPEGSLFSEDLQTFLGTQVGILENEQMIRDTIAKMETRGYRIPKDKLGQPVEPKVRASQSAKTTIIGITATSPNAAFTKDFLAQLINEYISYKKIKRQEVSGDTLATISSQVQKMETELKTAQEALSKFQLTNNLAILEEKGRVAGGYLARLETEKSDLILQHTIIVGTINQASGSDTNAPQLDISDIMRTFNAPGAAPAPNSERQVAFKDLQVLKMERERLSKYLRPKHPKMVKLNAEIDKGEKLVEIFRGQSRTQLSNTLAALQLKLTNVVSSITEWEQKVVEANTLIAEAERLRQNVNRSQGVYDRLALMLQNVDISKNIDQEALSLLQNPTDPERTFKQEIAAAGLALCASLALGILIVFLVELRDDRLISLTEITEKVGGNVVAQLPAIPAPSAKAPVPLLQLDDPRYMYAESYRNLRSAILFMDTGGQRPKTLLVTSAVPNEGKSTVAANLARTLAMGGASVVLIDGDLRKGVLHQLMGKTSHPGLTELLKSGGDVSQFLTPVSLNGVSVDQSIGVSENAERSAQGASRSASAPQASSQNAERSAPCASRPAPSENSPLPAPCSQLFLLPRGTRSISSGELFLTQAFDQLLAKLREQFDYVIIDSSPVFAADDAATLAPRVDGTVFVVRNSVSRARAVREALELLYQRQARVLGLIFNAANTASSSYYYYKYADYYPEPESKSEPRPEEPVGS